MPDGAFPDESSGSDRTLRVVLVLVLLATIVGGGVDLAFDAPPSWKSPHVFFELSLILGAIATFAWLWRGWWKAEHTLRKARQALVDRSAERDAWRSSAQSALAGLGQAIDERLAAWGLTPVEREIALLLLKGRSHKQIAYSTGRSERTVRQHAVAIYHKSGLGGRAELAAFFLEGLPELPAGKVPPLQDDQASVHPQDR
jgi:DNA-binding CsgD family transcriptional regulator